MEDASNKSGDGNKQASEQELIMRGIASQIIDEASQGKTDTTVLEIAQRIKSQALEKLDEDQANNSIFLKACDTVISYITSNPNKTVLDMFNENRKK